jgi:hypothetical protein
MGQQVPAHRFIFWTLSGVKAVYRDLVHHRRSSRHCINPEQLVIGLKAENLQDERNSFGQRRRVQHAVTPPWHWLRQRQGPPPVARVGTSFSDRGSSSRAIKTAVYACTLRARPASQGCSSTGCLGQSKEESSICAPLFCLTMMGSVKLR